MTNLHPAHTSHPLLRPRDGHARVTNTELFFDLVYVFAVTQLSHKLLGDLSAVGALQTLLLWFSVWLGWQYTCWVTNWFNPDSQPMRILLFVIMLVALVMSAALPDAFGSRGLLFAACYVTIQVGRTLVVLWHLGSEHKLSPNFQRILGWLCISGVFWIAGAFMDGPARIALWAIAIVCEYTSPMFGFALPVLGRSQTSDWTIDGGHIAERCQLFVMLALGESILVTGATLSAEAHWSAPVMISFLVAFIGSLSMWWIYFNTASHAAEHAITHSDDPGRLAGIFHYLHVIIVAGIVVCAVGSELFIAHPDGHMAVKYAAALIGGPAIYLAGNGIYKTFVYGRFPLSHLIGLAALAVLVPFAFMTDLLMVGGLATLILVVVAVWETRSRRSGSRTVHEA